MAQNQRQYQMASEADGRLFVMGCPIHKAAEEGTAWKQVHHCMKCPHHLSAHPMSPVTGIIICRI